MSLRRFTAGVLGAAALSAAVVGDSSPIASAAQLNLTYQILANKTHLGTPTGTVYVVFTVTDASEQPVVPWCAAYAESSPSVASADVGPIKESLGLLPGQTRTLTLQVPNRNVKGVVETHPKEAGVLCAASENAANNSSNWSTANIEGGIVTSTSVAPTTTVATVPGLSRTVASEEAWAASLGDGPIVWKSVPPVNGLSHWFGTDAEHLIDFEVLGPFRDVTTEDLTIFPGSQNAITSADQILAVDFLAARYGGGAAGTWATDTLMSAIHKGAFVDTDATKTFGRFRIEVSTTAPPFSTGYVQVTATR